MIQMQQENLSGIFQRWTARTWTCKTVLTCLRGGKQETPQSYVDWFSASFPMRQSSHLQFPQPPVGPGTLALNCISATCRAISRLLSSQQN